MTTTAANLRVGPEAQQQPIQGCAVPLCSGCIGHSQARDEVAQPVRLTFTDRTQTSVQYCRACRAFALARLGWMLQNLNVVAIEATS